LGSVQVLGDLLFGTGFFVAGCILLFAFSTTICDNVEHYIDGLFLFVLCQLLAVMMVYKVSQPFTNLFIPRMRVGVADDSLVCVNSIGTR
jgi:hypothetical protein